MSDEGEIPNLQGNEGDGSGQEEEEEDLPQEPPVQVQAEEEDEIVEESDDEESEIWDGSDTEEEGNMIQIEIGNLCTLSATRMVLYGFSIAVSASSSSSSDHEDDDEEDGAEGPRVNFDPSLPTQHAVRKIMK